ncbi:hypothetical protein, partial [Bartonella sp. TT110JLCBS]|uniref:hypothetical protein n=1 Tax=Bartonella sp. TT110JLCBS TaxID=3243578 RepID=UPI0035D0E843
RTIVAHNKDLVSLIHQFLEGVANNPCSNPGPLFHWVGFSTKETGLFIFRPDNNLITTPTEGQIEVPLRSIR